MWIKKRFLLICLFILLLSQDGLAFFKVKGKDILDNDGQKIILRGMGLGGWLVPEGYMLQTSAVANSPTEIRNKIQELIGAEATEQFFALYRANYIAEKDLQKIAEWGFNSVRLPFHYQDFSPKDQPGVFIEDGFKIVDQVLAWCKAHQLYLILDLHCAPGGQNDGNISDSDGVARLWTETQNQDRTVEIWRKIAERYASEPWIVGYDLLNEPVLPSGYSNSVLRSLYMRISRAIREVDPNHILFIEGNWYATDFSALTPPWDANMVYSFHKYWNENTVASIQNYLNIRNSNYFPLWLGEFGENSNTWFSASVRLMEQNEIGWCWWTPKKIASITSPLSAPITPNYQQVLDYWNGKTGKPGAELAKTGLFEMAEHLALEKCTYRPDVIYALTQWQRQEAVPFKSHSLPGKIYAVDYDLGPIGQAYFDVDDQRTRYDQDQPWNRGWSYRNDGVDIEKSSDALGHEFNVGWIETGEWLTFTVQISQAGNFDASFRIASARAGGKLELRLGEQKLATVDVPNTGGWQSWRSLAVKNIALPAGTQALRLVFVTGGFNLQYVEFLAGQSGVDDSTPTTFYLGQNYPNPFNQSTLIPIRMGEKSHLRLKIYNLAGELVRILADEEIGPGLTQFRWDGTTDGNRPAISGLYFYQTEMGGQKITRSMILLK